MSDEAPVVEEAKPMTAKEKAAARRRRILEKSRDRMQAVSGGPSPIVAEAPAPAPEPSSEESEDKAEATADDTPVEAEAETKNEDATGENKEEETPESPTKMSTSKRMQQMRRRRYQAAKEKAAAKEAEQEESAPESTSEEATSAPVVKEPEAVVTPATTVESNAEESTGEKKKYMGVVKMRRKKAAEKKKNEESAFEDELKELEKKLPALMKPKSVALGPILIQLTTVLLLFIAGFDVGVQNHAIVKQEVPYVHTNLSYVDHGVGVTKILGGKKEKPTVLTDFDSNDVVGNVEEDDEFGDVKKPAGASGASSSVPNIDPVFGVDFDKLTAGSGLFFAMARFAVSIHRTLTYFFFLLPLSIFRSIIAGPKKLFSNPPVLFLCSILIRYVGKHVFGGEIPKLEEMIEAEVKKDKEDKNEKPDLASTDFVSMGKNFVGNYVKGNFPKLVTAFSLMKDARADMFVVLCGLFVGLICPTGLLISTVKSDEL
ncbi:hypothetical protein CTEN210_07504 [Chaetoceros tenuissimus]|uniref:Uncharacterized protein n=1 Tax=Chaetoceros tenuissimus TaxID=426638 RepID=A0AAD3CSD0_9STRA|nr:hypothetical protein CTEN210_07504 [Chaetoceros tenuissimus]